MDQNLYTTGVHHHVCWVFTLLLSWAFSGRYTNLVAHQVVHLQHFLVIRSYSISD